MRKHLKAGLSIVGITIGAIALLLLLLSQFRPLRAEVHVGLIDWRPLCSLSPSEIEIDREHRWVAQMERGWVGWLKVWELKEDFTIGEKVLEIGGKGYGFFVRDIEWVGERLLISIVKGYDTLLEWDKQAEEVIDEKGRPTLRFGVRKPWEVRWLIYAPKTRQLMDLGVNRDLLNGKLFAHPSGDKVLIVKEREGGAFGTRRVKVVSLPNVTPFKPEIMSELGFSYIQVGWFLLPEYWFPKGQGFWAIGTDEHGHGKLFGVSLDSSVTKLTPNDHHLLHHKAQAYQGLIYEGGLAVDRLLPGLNVVTLKGELAILMSFPKREHEHVCIGYYSHERLERETVILDVNKPYPEVLKPLKKCVPKAIVPDGRRLILQEGWDAPYGEERRIWVWNIEGGTVTPLTQVGWITQVYGWLEDKWMVVEMKGEPVQGEIESDIGGKWIIQKATYEYGVIHVP